MEKKNFQQDNESYTEDDKGQFEATCLIKANETYESNQSDQFQIEHAAILHDIEELEKLVANLKSDEENSQYDNELKSESKAEKNEIYKFLLLINILYIYLSIMKGQISAAKFPVNQILSKTQLVPDVDLTSLNEANQLSFFEMDNSSCEFNWSREENYELELASRVKCSDQAIRSILITEMEKTGESIVLTCGGNYGDDEPILKWFQTADKKKNWVNLPMIEICPLTSVPIRPIYARINFFQKSKIKK